MTDLDSVCRSLCYAFEANGQSLAFLLRLIEFEVEHSTSTTTLFRNNSFASKVFKVFARMVGLPYLFRVLHPFMVKMYKEDAKERIVIEGMEEEKSKNTSVKELMENNYELNISVDESVDNKAVYEAVIDENALLVQIACEIFFTSLIKTMEHSPPSFHTVFSFLISLVSDLSNSERSRFEEISQSPN